MNLLGRESFLEFAKQIYLKLLSAEEAGFATPEDILHPIPNGIATSQPLAPGAVMDEILPESEATVKVRLLGSFSVAVKDRPMKHLPGRKRKELLAYLLINHKKRLNREVLMDAFWPNSTPESARNSLNVALHGIRKMFQELDPAQEYLLFRDDCYFFNPEIDIWLDVEEFCSKWRMGRLKEQENDIPEMLQEYKRAVNLYQGEFMEDNPYENWSEQERERLQGIYLKILERLSHYYSVNGKPLAAITLCERMLRKDNCQEDVHRRLMYCYYRLGQRDKAIRQYHKCAMILDSELNIAPGSETRKLYEEIKKDEGDKKNE